jgi:hypothetical protein
MKTISSNAVMIMLILTALISSCYYDNMEDLHPKSALDGLLNDGCDSAKTISFSADVQPILNANCGTSNSCHGANPNSGWSFNTYDGVKQAVDAERLLGVIKHEAGYSPMPKPGTPDTKMNECNIAIISKWVGAGAENN